jgi:hypothetical protein
MCTPGALGSQYICSDCINTMKKMLSKIAYPRRGTPEDDMDIVAAAEMIQDKFSSDQLEA